MLIDINITNFRSFNGKETFSMEKGAYLRKYKNNVLKVGDQQLLKTAILFGGNANGKTNLLQALYMLKFLVLRPTQSEDQPLPMDTFGYNKQPTIFEIKFIKNDKVFTYNLKYAEHEIINEVLEVDNEIIFNRERQNFLVLPAKLLALAPNIRKNQNLLFFAQSNNVLEAKEAFNWFKEDLIILNPTGIPNALFKLLNDEKFKAKFLKFLKAADFNNIVDVEVRERKSRFALDGELDFSDGENDKAVYITNYDVYSTHQAEGRTFKVHFRNESTGTQSFMFLALNILNNENQGKVLLVDEFNRSFHIELAEALLELFTDERQKNQFILTSHDLSLMDYKLRQDQIWFAEKNKYGETNLFSIYDFDDVELKRSDLKYKKRYLEGRFGASQIVNKSALLDIFGELYGTETEKTKK